MSVFWIIVLCLFAVVWVLSVIDIFRQRYSVWTTVAWLALIVILPIVGSIIYVLTRKPTSADAEQQYLAQADQRRAAAARVIRQHRRGPLTGPGPIRRSRDRDRTFPQRGADMSEEQFDELGPIDYVVLEWPSDTPVTGEVMPMLVDLVERGTIRILDIAVVVKDLDGSVVAGDLVELAQQDAGFAAFDGASSGLLGPEDLEEAGAVLEPGTVAAVLVWENRWAAPVAAALRRSGGQLVASGRIPVQAILASLDAAEAVR